MRNIETEIEALKEQIAMLEKEQQRGYVVVEDHYEMHFVQENHEIVYDLEDNIAAILVNADVVRKYLADKDAA